MNKLNAFLQRMNANFAMWMRQFMAGRYGVDKLNMFILVGGLIASVLSSLSRGSWLGFALLLISYGLMIWAIMRTLSRDTYRRYQENRKFLHFYDRFKDRKNVYFDCPKCRQTVRVPRGKGKIAITCPRCREKFTKKT